MITIKTFKPKMLFSSFHLTKKQSGYKKGFRKETPSIKFRLPYETRRQPKRRQRRQDIDKHTQKMLKKIYTKQYLLNVTRERK